jgi:hypothetical protein
MKKLSQQQEMIENYENLDLEILPEKFKKNGFIYELITREPKKCIYSQSNGRIVAYEVFLTKIQKYRERMIEFKKRNGQSVDDSVYKEYKEAFPGDEEFGKRAWSCRTLENAQARYERL